MVKSFVYYDGRRKSGIDFWLIISYSLVIMNATEILSKIQNHKGQTLTAVWESPVPCLSGIDKVVTKRTVAHVISGVEFGNRKEIKEAIEAGERGEVQPLPWGQWEQAPFIIGHKGKQYVRLYPPTEAQMETFHLKHESMFFANGWPITREQAIEFCGAKAKVKDSIPQCFSVCCDNIKTIG